MINKEQINTFGVRFTLKLKKKRISKGTVLNFKMKAQHANRIVNITHYGHQI